MKTDRVEIGSIFSNIKFWQKFSRYLLIGLSLIILLAGSQQAQLNNVLAQNPNPIPIPPPPPPAECTEQPAEYPQCGGTCNGVTFSDKNTVLVKKNIDTSTCTVSWECSDQGPIEGQCGNEPSPAVSCPDDLRYCDTNINKIVHKFGGVPDRSQPGGCRYAFEQEGACNVPAPAPAPATVTVCTGAVLTFDQLDAALRGANFPGPFDHSQAEIDAFNRAACPAAAPAPVPQNQFCTASYSVSPSLPQANSSISVNVSANSSNFQCIQIFQDNQPLSCASDALGVYRCTSNSGSAGTHTLQAKFGQSAAYPGVNCGVPVDCNAATFSVVAAPTPVPVVTPTPAPVVTPTPTPAPIQIVCQPALQTVQVNQFASLVSNNTGRPIFWSASNGNPSSGSGISFSTRFAQSGTFNVTVNDGLTRDICRVVVQQVVVPTPTPTPTPTPVPVADQNITLNCPDGRSITVVAGQNVNFNALCQAQQQQQNQVATAIATGGTSTITFGNVGVAAAPQPVVIQPAAVVQPVVVQPAVVPQVAGVSVTALPKTGLPFLAWSALAFIPAGFGLRRFKKLHKDLENDPTYIWEDRKFKAGV